MEQKEYAIVWRRIDRPGHESARVWRVGDGWEIAGSAVFLGDGLPCCLSYRVECDVEWRTERTTVSGWMGGRAIDLLITVGADGVWRLDEEPVPGLEECVDVDLNFSPSTNLLPIRRLNLAIGERAEVRAAWLRFPDFRLEPLEQTYIRTGQNTYRYVSAGGSFVRDLEVDEAGFVTRYPGFWEREGA